MKKYTRSILLGQILALSVLLEACDFSSHMESQNDTPNSMSIMTWNMQALFDGEDNGNEYDEYRMEKGWTAEKYAGRLSAISNALNSMDIMPDLIAIQEVESAGVVEAILAALSPQGYKWAHFANCADMALGIGIVSRFRITDTKVHSIIVENNTAPRPILEVRISRSQSAAINQSMPNGDLVLFVCHWKSKLGGVEITENIRRASARVLVRRIRELAEYEPGLPVVVAGDLNENHDEFYRRGGRTLCALLPDDPRSAEIAGLSRTAGNGNNDVIASQKDFIVISKNKPPVTRHFKEHTLALYSPWSTELYEGSYFYRDEWETIDHFLLSASFFDGGGWEFAGCSLINSAPFANAGGYPAVYNPRTGFGLSDHLPLLLHLDWQEK